MGNPSPYKKETYDPIKVGILGAGASARYFHAPFLKVHPGFKFERLFARRPEEAAAHFPGVDLVSDLDQFLEEDSLELVIVTTPNHTHFEYAMKALKAGKQVVVEKPLASTAEEAAELFQVAKAAGQTITVYQNRRFDADFLTLAKILEGGSLGDLVELESQYDRYRPEFSQKKWKELATPGTGIVYDLGSHLLDQAVCLFGLPAEVSATVASFRPGSVVDDYFFIHLTYPTHLVRLRASSYVLKPGPRFAAHGTKGSFVKFGLDPQEELLMKGVSPDGGVWVEESETQWGKLYQVSQHSDSSPLEAPVKSENGNYMRFYDQVYSALREGGRPPVSETEAVNLIRLIELTYRADLEKKTLPVSRYYSV